MGKLIDLNPGTRFGRLVVLARAENKGSEVQWLCKCDCGTIVAVNGKSLRRGQTKSCGCIRDELTAERFTTHGATKSDKTNHDYRIYAIWRTMIDRCYNPHCTGYDRYGGRGIIVCAEWLHSFEAFRMWAKNNGYQENLSIDRLNGMEGYTPENCRWATPVQQTRNRKCTRFLTYMGEKKTIMEWATKYNLPYHVVKNRINRGWPIERALTEPVHTVKNQ